MSQVTQSAGGRAKFGHEAQTEPASAAHCPAALSAFPAPRLHTPDSAAPVSDAGQLRLDLCHATLHSVVVACSDLSDLLRDTEDDGSGILTRVVEARLRMLGMEVDRVLQHDGAVGLMGTSDEWVLSPQQLELMAQTKGSPA